METKDLIVNEDGYTEFMNTTVARWLAESVHHATFKSFDGTTLSYFYAIPKEHKANIQMFHGFSEGFPKYHEMAYYFYSQGYAFFFLEMRGHGYSGRFIDNEDYVYIEDYDKYVEDEKAFYDRIVRDKLYRKPLYLFSFSMGGAVAALFIEKYPEAFRKAVMTSPMLEIRTGGIPWPVVHAVMFYAKRRRVMKTPGPGQHPFDAEHDDYNRDRAISKSRYDYVRGYQVLDHHYRTCCATYAWMDASFKADKKLMRHAKEIQTPILLFSAGADELVEPKAHEEFARKAQNVQLMRYDDSHHEIFSDKYETRLDFYTRMFDFISEP